MQLTVHFYVTSIVVGFVSIICVRFLINLFTHILIYCMTCYTMKFVVQTITQTFSLTSSKWYMCFESPRSTRTHYTFCLSYLLTEYVTKKFDLEYFIRHDISTSQVDSDTKNVLEKCVADNYVDKFITNLKVSSTVDYSTFVCFTGFICISYTNNCNLCCCKGFLHDQNQLLHTRWNSSSLSIFDVTCQPTTCVILGGLYGADVLLDTVHNTFALTICRL